MDIDYTLRVIYASALHAARFTPRGKPLHHAEMETRLLTAKEIGELLHRRRVELGLEVRDLCERIDGLEPSAYYNYENGLRAPNKSNALRLSTELGIPYGTLMGKADSLCVREEPADYLDPGHLARALDFVRTARRDFGMPDDPELEAKAVISIYKKLVLDHAKEVHPSEESTAVLRSDSSHKPRR